MDESLINRITEWIGNQTKNAGAVGAVVGLSGGVDSSVTVALCKKALGENVLGVLMPCHSSEGDLKDAEKTASRFGIKTEKVDLTKVFDDIKSTLPEGSKIAEANIKPRLRMITLYHFANSRNYIVAGTGNKTELMVGYFTKYGDGGVDILPLGSLYKKQVYEIARKLEVPESVLEKSPSAGLWDGQTDEEEIGVTYKDMDEILSKIENNEDTSDFDQKAVERIRQMIEKNRHKVEPLPVFKL